MVAYSFKKFFRTPIRIGLGLEEADQSPGAPRAKRQTIRDVGRRRHALPGETLQLYTGMRTKACELIGTARCTNVQMIRIRVDQRLVLIGEGPELIAHRAAAHLDVFAQQDGFASWDDMADFWRENHGEKANDFRGRIIFWEPMPASGGQASTRTAR